MKGVILHSGAKDELAEAITYYAKQEAGLGRELRAVVNIALQDIRRHPRRYPQHIAEIRRRALQRFPYTIYNAELGDIIWVIAVAHQRREPNYWVNRQMET